jgi:hypothetical protein
MSVRLAQRCLTAALMVAGATAVAAGPAGASVVPAAAQAAPLSNHGHGHPNCNNDPDSEFAMDPEVCPPSNNADAYDGQYDYPGDDGYGYSGRY